MQLQQFDAGFRSSRRTMPVDTLLVHESVTVDPGCADQTIAVLKRRGLGVHAAIDATGGVVQLAPWDRIVSHAVGLNRRAIGIEVVTPYYPLASGRAPAPWQQVISAAWAHKGSYVLPLPEQLEGLWDLLQFLERTLPLSLYWPGLVGDRFCMERLAGGLQATGVQAHTYTDHADGALPVLYAWLRSRGLDASEAYPTVIRLGQRARAWADVSPFTPPAAPPASSQRSS